MNLLLLADGRFPAGGHAHSGGMETAVAAGAVKDMETLSAFLAGRLATAGLSAAGLAAASCTLKHPWATLDAEADARTPSPALREVGRRQGRQMLRTARALRPGRITRWRWARRLRLPAWSPSTLRGLRYSTP
jgi:urease accessory protein